MNQHPEMLLGFVGHPIGADAFCGLEDDREHAGGQTVLARIGL